MPPRDRTPGVLRGLYAYDYEAMGRKGGHAAQAHRRARAAAAPASLRLVRPAPEDVLRGAAASYARALTELHEARGVAARAYQSLDDGAIRRALRSVWAANAEADRCYELLLATGGR